MQTYLTAWPTTTDDAPKARLHDDGLAVLELGGGEDYVALQFRASEPTEAVEWLDALIASATVLLDGIQRRQSGAERLLAAVEAVRRGE